MNILLKFVRGTIAWIFNYHLAGVGVVNSTNHSGGEISLRLCSLYHINNHVSSRISPVWKPCDILNSKYLEKIKPMGIVYNYKRLSAPCKRVANYSI